MRLAALSVLLLVGLPSLAQNARITGQIEGRILRAGTNEPVAGARVQIAIVTPGQTASPFGQGSTGIASNEAGAPPPSPRLSDVRPSASLPALLSLETASDGRFAFEDLAAGSYRMLVTKDGYVRQEYGQLLSSARGKEIEIGGGQALKNLVVQITPTGSIGGRIFDNYGQPAVAVAVQLSRATYNVNGQVVLRTVSTTKTNDRGEYRLYWITPGSYYLIAGSDGDASNLRPAPGANPNDSVQVYGLSYYPGVPDLQGASIVDLRPASELTLDFRTPRAQPVRIRGRVMDVQTGRPPASVGVMLASRSSANLNLLLAPAQGYNSADGAFEVRNVPSGAFLLQVIGGSGPALGSVPIVIANQDLENIVITLTTGIRISGRFRFEGPPIEPRAMERLSVGLIPVGLGLSPQRMGRTPNDETFDIENVMPGEYRLNITGFPSGYYVKEARIGALDVLNQPVVVSDPPSISGTLEILLSPNSGQIAGIVADGNFKPQAGVQVVLVPDRSRNRAELFKSAVTDSAGRFVLTGVVPGDYKVFSWEVLESFAYFDPGRLKQFEARALPVHVGESSKQEIRTTVLSAN